MAIETGFRYESHRPGYAQSYLEPEILGRLGTSKCKILDIGCGNGALATALAKLGHEVYGSDWDQAGVDLANQGYPGRFLQWDLNRPAVEFPFSGFEVVISTEVIEEGKEGLIVPAGDAEALRERMRWCERNPGKVEEMGRAAHLRGKEYTWENYGKKYSIILTHKKPMD
jgi:SAM-dependent methyltransferase